MVDFLHYLPSGATLIGLAVGVAMLKKDIKHLGETVKGVVKAHKECQDKRENAEADLHGRVTAVSERTARIEAKMNGYLRKPG